MMLDVRVFRSSNVVSDRHSLVDEPPSVLILSDQQEMKTEAVTEAAHSGFYENALYKFTFTYLLTYLQ